MPTAPAEALPCGPDVDGADAPYWDGLREGVVKLPRCSSCGDWQPIGRVLCGSCWSFDFAWTAVEPAGTVFSWIRTERDFMSELDASAPYVSVLVELDGAPLRLLGLLRGGSVSIGDRVRGVIEEPTNATWPVLRWVSV
ncbi:Zn-ribbon domain-containing OB-fold protein [Nocardioides ultimimeridianus]